MTAADKRERREAKHQAQALLKRHVVRRQGLFCTGPQLRAATKVLTDRWYAETIKPAVKITMAELEAAK